MAWYLTREYGDSIEVNYRDLSQANVREQFPAVMEQLQKGDLVLPAVYVNDKLASLGYVDYFEIAKALGPARGNGHTEA